MTTREEMAGRITARAHIDELQKLAGITKSAALLSASGLAMKNTAGHLRSLREARHMAKGTPVPAGTQPGMWQMPAGTVAPASHRDMWKGLAGQHAKHARDSARVMTPPKP